MKPTVLFITGWAHGATAIQPLADALSDAFDVQLLTGARVLRNRSIPDSDYIVTGSMGGLLSMEMLPPSCKKLVLLSSTARFCATEDYPHGTPERILRRMIMQLKRNPTAVLNEFFKNVHFPHRESRQAHRMRHEKVPDVDELTEGLEYLAATDLRAQIGTIQTPVLLMHGTEDRIIPYGASEWLHANLPNSQLIPIESDGHALAAHHFTTIVKHIRTFL